MHRDANGSLPGGLRTNNRRSKSAQCGFSLIELIVVIAIMAVLVGLLAPQYVKFVREKRHTTCQHNREAILRLYEKCVYDNSIEEATNKDGGAFLNSMLAGGKAYLNEDMKEYMDCPNRAGSHTQDWTGGVSDDGTAYITCPDCEAKLSLPTADYATVDIWGMNYEDKEKKGDSIVTPTPTPTPTDVPEPTIEPTPTDEPTPTPDNPYGVFPYASRTDWWNPDELATSHGGYYTNPDLRYRGTVTATDSSIMLRVPTKIFSSKSGARYVFIRTGGEYIKIYYKDASSPEYYISSGTHAGDCSLIQLSGTTHVIKAEDVANNRKVTVTVVKGDIVKFIDTDGTTYMYVGRQNEETSTIGRNEFNKATSKTNQIMNWFRVASDEEYDAYATH